MLIRKTFTTNPAIKLRGEVDRLFEDWFDRGLPAVRFEPFGLASFPAVNLREDSEALHLEAELPGVTIDELDLSVQADELTIKGERTVTDADDARHYHRRERRTGMFERVIQLPIEVDTDKIQAKLVDGVLTVTMPKAQSVLPRKISIEAD